MVLRIASSVTDVLFGGKGNNVITSVGNGDWMHCMEYRSFWLSWTRTETLKTIYRFGTGNDKYESINQINQTSTCKSSELMFVMSPHHMDGVINIEIGL